jgi:hypothetical protein
MVLMLCFPYFMNNSNILETSKLLQIIIFQTYDHIIL